MAISTTLFDADDLVREILLRVDHDEVTLISCAATCKRWLRIVADPSFRLRWLR
jgi:hypothetical protein